MGLFPEPRPCPVCDRFDCTHRFYGDDHFRIGDPMEKHPKMKGRTIPAPHRIVDEDLERVVFGPGDLMTAEEAVRYGVALPGQAPPDGRRKGMRQKPSTPARPQGPENDRARRPARNRGAA